MPATTAGCGEESSEPYTVGMATKPLSLLLPEFWRGARAGEASSARRSSAGIGEPLRGFYVTFGRGW